MNPSRLRFSSHLAAAALMCMLVPAAPRTACAGNVAAGGVGGQNCTYTIGFWKSHPDAWPVSTVTLGTVTYNQSQIALIFAQPVQGNGLVSLAHQLIAARFNVAQGANAANAAAAIAQADALIGGLVCPPVGIGSLAPAQSSAITASLDSYNNGNLGPFHCGSTTPARQSTWGSLKSFYR